MFAYRIVHDVSLFQTRSFCPKCHTTLAWYDTLPIISWAILLGKCRSCGRKISLLYPFIEVLSLFVFLALVKRVTYPYSFSYFIFFSALLITIRTDLETMLISRFVTIFLIPVGLILALFNLLPISFGQSLLGSFFGYFSIFMIDKIFTLITKKKGIGEGDKELMAFIGTFTGVLGCWISLLIGSLLGSFFGIFYIIIGRLNWTNKIPFGAFLSLSAIIFVLFKDKILNLIFGF